MPAGFLGEPSLEEREIAVPDSPHQLSRAVIALPTRRDRSAKLPLLVLLHGLGETVNPKLGLRAWLDAYGLGATVAHLQEGHLSRDAKYEFLSRSTTITHPWHNPNAARLRRPDTAWAPAARVGM